MAGTALLGEVWSFRPVSAGAAAAVATQPAEPLAADVPAEPSDQRAASEIRLAEAARYLASDELEGRGLGTPGIDKAAEFIAEQFRRAGCDISAAEGQPFQKFAVSIGTELGKHNQLVFLGPAGNEPPADSPDGATPADSAARAAGAADVPAGAAESSAQNPQRIELELGKQFTPLVLSGSASFNLPLVFAGYGITAEAEGYDEYKDLDVRGKAVIVLRHEPRQRDEQSVFAGAKDSPHAFLARKVDNARQHGAAAVLFCTDQVEIEQGLADLRRRWKEAVDRLAAEHARYAQIEQPTPEQAEDHRWHIGQLIAEVELWDRRIQDQYDRIVSFAHGGRGPAQANLPVVHCSRGPIDRIVRQSLGTSLGQIERAIDEQMAPQSRELPGWRVAGQIEVVRKEVSARNVVGVVPGEGPRAEETIVVGAHYDHLGRGQFASLAREPGAIHNGADDNASGTAVLIELAHRLARRQARLPRRVVLIALTGEERGLFGSAYYVAHPLVPLERTIAMINLDMVGRMRDEKLQVIGSATGDSFRALLDRANAECKLNLVKLGGGAGPSDQAMFFAHRVPVLHFFTGMHADYHRPSDDFNKLNVEGMRRVADLVEALVVELAETDAPPRFVAVGPAQMFGGDGRRPFLGTIPEFGVEVEGYAIAGVVPDGPAERAGLRAGDMIVEFAGQAIRSLAEIDAALRRHEAGQRVPVTVRRGDEQLKFDVTLGDPR